MKPNSINFNKKSELKSIAIAAIILSLIALLSTIAFSIPNSLTLQGKLTDLAGASQQGTFNFTFKIYDAATDGNELWAVINQSVATDANGIYDIILNGLNLTFADQYYLGIAVQGENESQPRINLTSSPYSFRANTSETLNPNQSFVVRNLSITGNATIGDGTTTLTISTQGFNLTTIGNVFIGSNLSIAGNSLFVDGLNQRVGIGTTLPYNTLTVVGSVGVSGALNASSINTTGSAYFATSTGNVGIGTTSPINALTIIGSVTAFGSLNATFINASSIKVGTNDVQTVNAVFNLVNYSAEYSSTGYQQVNFTIDLVEVNASIALWNISGSNIYPRDLSDNVGIGTANPTKKLSINGTIDAITFDPSASPNPVMNTTGNNLTISSAAGSVIIRLG